MADMWEAGSSTPPASVRSALKNAIVRHRIALMRAARRNRTYPGPLAEAAPWHSEHLAERR